MFRIISSVNNITNISIEYNLRHHHHGDPEDQVPTERHPRKHLTTRPSPLHASASRRKSLRTGKPGHPEFEAALPSLPSPANSLSSTCANTTLTRTPAVMSRQSSPPFVRRLLSSRSHAAEATSGPQSRWRRTALIATKSSPQQSHAPVCSPGQEVGVRRSFVVEHWRKSLLTFDFVACMSDSEVWGCILGFGTLNIVFICIQIWLKDRATMPPHIFRGQRTVTASALFDCFRIIYYTPIYFQAIKNTTAEESGIRCIPFLVSVTISAALSGASITILGPLSPVMWIGSAILVVGAWMLYTLQPDSGPGM
ncbi:hypothetical protein AC579_3775 [Pseudocercospora musae]|uniref:Uncharacterized protein n=1 Tax=Pseudocercospora musae TaxID=113226 RepID=A0A139INF6_9PEZI|nr:hypothetical protein AC579_3775 [Pseudocercospora musae]